MKTARPVYAPLGEARATRDAGGDISRGTPQDVVRAAHPRSVLGAARLRSAAPPKSLAMLAQGGATTGPGFLRATSGNASRARTAVRAESAPPIGLTPMDLGAEQEVTALAAPRGSSEPIGSDAPPPATSSDPVETRRLMPAGMRDSLRNDRPVPRGSSDPFQPGKPEPGGTRDPLRNDRAMPRGSRDPFQPGKPVPGGAVTPEGSAGRWWRGLAASAALAVAALSMTACTDATVVRVIDGREVVGRFVSARAYALYARGADAEARGDMESARLEYLAAAAEDEANAEVWTRVGAVSCALGRADDAQSAFGRADERAPGYEPLHRERAARAYLGPLTSPPDGSDALLRAVSARVAARLQK